MSPTAPPKPKSPPPRPSQPSSSSSSSSSPPKSFSITTKKSRKGERVLLYGPDGVGKTSLVAQAENPTWLDLEDSTKHIEGINRVDGVNTWADMRAALQSDSLWNDTQTIAIDTLTAAQELCQAHLFATRKAGQETPTSLEDYGYGKGYRYFFEEFEKLLADLDRQVNRGKDVVLVCHSMVTMVPNPAGEDYKRFEPYLQASDKNNIRDRVCGWADHILFMRMDIAVDEKTKKARGSGTRCVWPVGQPGFRAKSRKLREEIEIVEGESALWNALFSKEGA